ncbi:hypothetical protein L484_000278 [Morus notabilis]|uniref:Uncharacterized protein n=1 Tax=Morus notabilis TaxID=981085 RepID=W9SDV4_9ROSA|nr:hypothetical protein L484_000278 [Morus notabilis]
MNRTQRRKERGRREEAWRSSVDRKIGRAKAEAFPSLSKEEASRACGGESASAEHSRIHSSVAADVDVVAGVGVVVVDVVVIAMIHNSPCGDLMTLQSLYL